MKDVESQNGNLRFPGLPPVGGLPSAIEFVRVFVMPDVMVRPELEGGRGEARRMVILGGPGSGKTTLLQSFCFGFTDAGRSHFTWRKVYPNCCLCFIA
jgi:hypothetical protein